MSEQRTIDPGCICGAPRGARIHSQTCPLYAPMMVSSGGSLTSNERLEGELWSFLRSTLTQGEDIMHDYEHRGYEEKSARLDAAARERVEKLLKLLRPAVETDGKRRKVRCPHGVHELNCCNLCD